VALVLGLASGAAGLLYVQQEHMAPRLSVRESQELMAQISQLGTALADTQARLDKTSQDLAVHQARNEELSQSLAQARTAIEPLQRDISLLQEVLPPDPRGGDLQIRAGRFYNRDEGLSYHVVLSQEEQDSAFKGALQFVVQGRYPNGRAASVEIDPMPLEFDDLRNLQGTVDLPEGMHATQITTSVLNGDGSTGAMRVINTRD